MEISIKGVFPAKTLDFSLLCFVFRLLFHCFFRGFVFAESAEKPLHDLAALWLQKTFFHFHLMVEARLIEQIQNRSGAACLAVSGAEHHSGNPCLDDGAGTHRTRLYGHIQCAVLQPPIPYNACRFVDHINFRMAQRIFLPYCAYYGHGR